MGRKSKSSLLCDKSVQAALAAIELYNKPVFSYREESFAILMVNAWELLLKARIVRVNNEKLDSIQSKNPKKDGKTQLARTISFNDAVKKCALPPNLEEQLYVLQEIRDTSIHFYNPSERLKQECLEVGTATLESYSTRLIEWFEYPLSKHQLFLMPIAFNMPRDFSADSISKEPKSIQYLLNYIEKAKKMCPHVSGGDSISISVELNFTRDKSGIAVTTVKEGGILLNEDVDGWEQRKFPLSFRGKGGLVDKLKDRFIDFKQDKRFWTELGKIKKNEKLCKRRRFNPSEESRNDRFLYSTNVLKEFDTLYTKRA
jgi:hypothetical protein